ncbi:CBU_0592 family membrane protein [Jannaschia aquimarina]|uniref:CBU-0592-like domain-containing protein n=1 Tax=Jannaschia aquimarina TaxID=935700 RepID=A0A0D1EIH6_9RHOB|nr:hypothetical protein [Jannaschia aquimarina]KIT17409.1 hypothetical protein jaqu_08240 [Jannaschia aquimarina]SNT24302.1 hypothetical protein SAMN05421775_108178 [Jannaschia aquimarina]
MIAYFDLSPPILQMLGIAGAGLYMTNFALLTSRVLSSEMVTYYVLNIGAAFLVLLSLAGEFNLAALAIQLFWIVVSFWGVITRLFRPRPILPSERLSPLP